MSLEAVIQENTATMRELIAALAHTQVRPATTQEVGDTTATSIKVPAEKPKREAPKTEPIAEPVAETPAAPIAYTDLAAKFRKLAAKSHDAAWQLLQAYGVDNLKKIGEAQYGEVSARIDKELAV